MGMNLEQVSSIINEGIISPNICSWRYEETKEFSLSTRDKCSIPTEFDGNRRITLNVLYMGPAFQHNEFDVEFSKEKVISISELRKWD